MESGMLVTLVISAFSGSLAGYLAHYSQMKKLQKDYLLQDSAQRVAFELLSHEKWSLRSFKVIRHHLGGFDDDELRKILVRAGAIRFMSKSGLELWGLLERNKKRLGVTKIDGDPSNVSDDSLFLK